MYTLSSIRQKKERLESPRSRFLDSSSYIFKIILMILFVLLVSSFGFFYGSFQGIIASAPKRSIVSSGSQGPVLYDAEGRTLGRVRREKADTIHAKSSDISPHLKNAFIAIEDERFYDHNGIDVKGILRSAINDVHSSSTSQGGSTITQQLVRNLYFHSEHEMHFVPKLTHKIQEQYVAVQLEKKGLQNKTQSQMKDSVLTSFLNTINLGRGHLGVESAARYYFNKSAKDLTISQCAIIAAIGRNPEYYDPIDEPEANNERRERILEKMYNLKYINAKEYQQALNEDDYSRIVANTMQRSTNSNYFTDALMEQVVQDLQEKHGYTQAQAYELFYGGGLKIHTTEDSRLQQIADHEISNPENYSGNVSYLLEYTLTTSSASNKINTYNAVDLQEYYQNHDNTQDDYPTYSNLSELREATQTFKDFITSRGEKVLDESIRYTPQPQASFTLIDQKTGKVRALVGGRGQKHYNLSINRASDEKHDPGSLFSVLSAYAPGIDNQKFTLASVFDDAPYKYMNGNEVLNTTGKHNGLTNIRTAIATGNNVVAVKALTKISPQVGYDFLKRLGFSTLVKNRVNKEGFLETDVRQALALGNLRDGVTNLELTNAYATIANGGVYHRPIFYTSVEDADGNVILHNKVEGTRVMKASTAWLLTNAMRDVITTGTGRRAKLKNTHMSFAGNTGTTVTGSDYWFSGYTPYLTGTIWMGSDTGNYVSNPNHDEQQIYAKIMNRIIKSKKEKSRDFPSCEVIKSAAVCQKSGKLSIDGICDKDPEKSMVYREFFTRQTLPKRRCDVHIRIPLCKISQKTYGTYCPKNDLEWKVFRVKPIDSKGNTADTPYLLTFDPEKNPCRVHNKRWYGSQIQKNPFEN